MNILICIGTRPEIIKMAPVYHALRAKQANVTVLHSGQHTDLAEPLYKFFKISNYRPEHITRESGTLDELTCLLTHKIGSALDDEKPDLVMVHGDTTTCLAGALTSFYRQIPIAHVEAGLRTNAISNPFPEEANRQIVARLATHHFAPTKQARANLLREGIANGVYVVGNTAIDAAHYGIARLNDDREKSHVSEKIINYIQNIPRDGRLLLITAHRRENWGNGIKSIATAVSRLLESDRDLHAVWPVHPNPHVKSDVTEHFAAVPNEMKQRLLLTAPLDYPELLYTLNASWIVLTDSGGIQEEATALNKPVLILRSTTERPEVLNCGRGQLVGTDSSAIQMHVKALRTNPKLYESMTRGANPFGDGTTASTIADHLYL